MPLFKGWVYKVLHSPQLFKPLANSTPHYHLHS